MSPLITVAFCLLGHCQAEHSGLDYCLCTDTDCSHQCENDAVPEMLDGPDDASHVAELEVSLLQTSLKLSRQESSSAAKENKTAFMKHENDTLDSSQLSFIDAGSTGSFSKGVSGAGGSFDSSSFAPVMDAITQGMNRVREVIDLPRACVLSLALVLTLIALVLLWGIIMGAARAVVGVAKAGKSLFTRSDVLEPADFHKGASSATTATSSSSENKKPKGSVEKPPSICPALLLPHGAAQFQIPSDHLSRLRAGQFPVQILGPSGRPLLHAWLPIRGMEDEKGQIGFNKVGRWLQLTTSANTRYPHASIGPLPYQTPVGRQALEIYGPSNTKYGTLRRDKDKWHVCYSAGAGPEQLLLSMHAATPLPGFSASSAEGKQMALASHNLLGTGMASAETLTINVEPGCDALLTLISMLAVVLSMFEQVSNTSAVHSPGQPVSSRSLNSFTDHSSLPEYQPDS